MTEHPIEGLMTTAMNNIKDMVDVNTIIGDPIQASNNTVIIPISRVSFGFAAGGSEFKGETIEEYSSQNEDEEIQYRLPFGGGAGAGVSINPTAFIVVQQNLVKLLPVNHDNVIDKILDYIPDIIDKTNGMINKCIENKKDLGEKIVKTMKQRCEQEKSNQDSSNKNETKDEIKEEIEIDIEQENNDDEEQE